MDFLSLHYFVSFFGSSKPSGCVINIYTNLWSAPLCSHDGFKYYLIFIDLFSKYIWLYPLKLKSDTKNVFIRFKALVEKKLQLPLITLYFENGGEYDALK